MIVGLTGGIGSGKSFVASLFKNLGISVYISDVEAKRILNTNSEVKLAVISLFGKQSYVNDQLNREYIANQVFSNKEKLAKLNEIVHPAVEIDFKEWREKQTSEWVLKESAILFETGGDKYCDKIILVTAPLETRINRVIKRDLTTREAILRRIENQWSDVKKINKSDFVLENIDKEIVKNEVFMLFKTLNEFKGKC